jgi:hypothetical protein
MSSFVPGYGLPALVGLGFVAVLAVGLVSLRKKLLGIRKNDLHEGIS